jgi:hypothetical protein
VAVVWPAATGFGAAAAIAGEVGRTIDAPPNAAALRRKRLRDEAIIGPPHFDLVISGRPMNVAA